MACASRRTAASRSCCSKHSAIVLHGNGRVTPGRFLLARHGRTPCPSGLCRVEDLGGEPRNRPTGRTALYDAAMNNDQNPWSVLREEIAFSCSYFDVRQDLV